LNKSLTRIATEQLAFREPKVHHPVFVNLIDYNTALPGTIQPNHYKAEGQKVTLQAQREYCHNHSYGTKKWYIYTAKGPLLPTHPKKQSSASF
jgi:hypothetical protein